MGLCMGFSFVSLLEIVYFGILALVNTVRCSKNKEETEIEDLNS